MLLYAEPISPLLFNRESVDNLLFCAEKGIPVRVSAFAQHGRRRSDHGGRRDRRWATPSAWPGLFSRRWCVRGRRSCTA